MPPVATLVNCPVQSLVLVKEVVVAKLKHGHGAEDDAADEGEELSDQTGSHGDGSGLDAEVRGERSADVDHQSGGEEGAVEHGEGGNGVHHKNLIAAKVGHGEERKDVEVAQKETVEVVPAQSFQQTPVLGIDANHRGHLHVNVELLLFVASISRH